MRLTARKVMRNVSLVLLVVGIVLTLFGAAVNQAAFNMFLTLLNQVGFKSFLLGILLMLIAIVLLGMSFFAGRGKGARPNADAGPRPEPQPAPARQPEEGSELRQRHPQMELGEELEPEQDFQTPLRGV